MRKNMKKAFSVFLNGGEYHTQNKSINVIGDKDNSVLYSYKMPIAWRKDSLVIATQEKGPSVTTSSHIHMLNVLIQNPSLR